MHSRLASFFATCVAAVAACYAADVSGPRPPPTPPPPPLPSSSPPPGQRPIDQAQREFDRTTGRIVDQPTYELNQIQSPPLNDLEQIERDRDRQELIDRQQRAIEKRNAATLPPIGSAVGPLPTAGAVVVLDEDKQGLEAEILEAVVAYERGTRQADATLATNPTQLQARRRQLGSQLEHRLDAILSHYTVRRFDPTTRPAR